MPPAARGEGGKAFGFVEILELPPKPREVGLVEVRGPYYTPVPTKYLEALLEDWGEYIDGYKFAGGSQRLLSRETVKRIITLCHDHGVYVSTGGFVERVILQGPGAVDTYLEECKALGFDVVEVSSGLAPISLEDKLEIVKQVKAHGLKAKPEITVVEGAGAGTRVVGYGRRMRARGVEDVVREASLHLEAGAHMLMLESEGVTEGLPPGRWRKDLVRRLVDSFGVKKWMFEAAEPEVFKWYLKTFGRDVNLFIDHSQIVEYTAWRCGLWGDRDIWKGKSVKYRG